MMIIEQLSDTHIRVFKDAVLLYDSHNTRNTRYATETNTLDGPLKEGLERKELAELFY